jgi:hypothetical protein
LFSKSQIANQFVGGMEDLKDDEMNYFYKARFLGSSFHFISLRIWIPADR